MTNKFEDIAEKFNLSNDTIVTLYYEDAHEGWHSSGDLESEALNQTDVADTIASLITLNHLETRTYHGNNRPLDEMRELGLLDDYERGSFTFQEFIANAIKENRYDLDEFVEFQTEHYDNKRGRCTVSTRFNTTLGVLKDYGFEADCWTASFPVHGGRFTFDS